MARLAEGREPAEASGGGAEAPGCALPTPLLTLDKGLVLANASRSGQARLSGDLRAPDILSEGESGAGDGREERAGERRGGEQVGEG